MKYNKLRKFLIIIGLFLILPEFVFAADIQSMVQKITSFIGSSLSAIGTIIIIGVGIYFMKNLDRWKEIFITCISIIAATLIIMNAPSIANMIFR